MDEEVLEQEVAEEAGEAEQPSPQVDPEKIKRAKMMGWVDKDQFRGDPDKWRPADEFIARADELMPIMRSQMRKYEDTISSLQTELKGTRETVEKIVKVSEKTSEMAYERALSDIRKRQLDAVAAGDTQQWLNLEDEKSKLPRPEPVEFAPKQPPHTTDQQNPLFTKWHTDNEWYLSDPAMTRYANAYAAENQNPNIPYMTWLDMVGEAVKEAFPHKFQNPNRAKPAAVDGGAQRGAVPGKPKSKGYNDLPVDAKRLCDKYVSSGLYKTKEDYVKVYFEEE